MCDVRCIVYCVSSLKSETTRQLDVVSQVRLAWIVLDKAALLRQAEA